MLEPWAWKKILDLKCWLECVLIQLVIKIIKITGADLRSVATEAGMYAIRARRKAISERDLLDAIEKVIKGYSRFSATQKYMVYNWLFMYVYVLDLMNQNICIILQLLFYLIFINKIWSLWFN